MTINLSNPSSPIFPFYLQFDTMVSDEEIITKSEEHFGKTIEGKLEYTIYIPIRKRENGKFGCVVWKLNK